MGVKEQYWCWGQRRMLGGQHSSFEDRLHRENASWQTKYGGEHVLLATQIAGRMRLEPFCSIHVWDEELPFKPSWFVVMMNGEESLWGEEGASYKPNSLYQFSLWKTPIKSIYKVTGFVLVSSSLRRGMKATWGLTPQPWGPRQRKRGPVPALFWPMPQPCALTLLANEVFV